MGTRPVVLIARLETDKTVYALEREDANLYTLCKLGSWVDLERLSGHATVAYSKLIRPRAPVAANAVEPETTTTPQLHKENKKRRLAIEAIQSLVKKPARSQSISLASQGPEITQTPTPVENDVASQFASLPAPPETANGTPESQAGVQTSIVPVPEDVLAQPTANDIFDNVRNQYFEALYHSMVSLLTPFCATAI
jgi:DNA replication regulator SLD3